MLVRDIMTSPAVTIGPDDEVAEATRVLDRLNLTSLPVVDHDRRPLGIISEADLITQVGDRPPEPGSLVRDLMTTRLLTVAADDDVTRAVELLRGTILKSLPVVLHGRVVGMLSRRDVVRAMAHGGLDARDTDTLSRT